MTPREKLLVALVASLLIGWIGWRSASAYLEMVDRRQQEAADLDQELFKKGLEARGARGAMSRLAGFQETSLPSDVDVARSAYAAWLVEAIEGAGLELDDVRQVGSRRLPGVYTALTFNAEAAGSPEGVIRLLDRYHRLGLLHQLTKLHLKAIEGDADRWNVSLTSVALVVDGSRVGEGVPQLGDEDRLRLADAGAYIDSIVGRNLYAAYEPPPPPAPPRGQRKEKPKPPKPSPPPFDDAEHAQLTGVVETGRRLEAWVRVRTTGQTLRLHEGDPVEVGLLKGRVLAVEPRRMVIEADGKRWSTPLGEMLRGETTSGGEGA